MTNSSTIEALASSARLAASVARADELAQALWFAYLLNTKEHDNNAVYLLSSACFSANLISKIAEDQSLPTEKVLSFFLEHLHLLLKGTSNA